MYVHAEPPQNADYSGSRFIFTIYLILHMSDLGEPRENTDCMFRKKIWDAYIR